jgi:hypothetical protein
MTRPPTQISDAAALVAWMDDAHAAIELGHCISEDMAFALLATPTTAGAFTPPGPRTWFLEEYEQVMRRQLRDPVPFGGTDAEVTSWREKQTRRGDELAALLHDHTRAVASARAFIERLPAPARKRAERAARKGAAPRPRATAAEAALAAVASLPGRAA